MAYFRCTTGGSGKGNTLVVTCADDLAGATITCTNGTKTYNKTCPSTSPYEVTFYGLAAGTWTVSATVSGNTYTTTVVITDYEAELGGFSWRAWVNLSENYTSSDFTDLDELLDTELAVRELMSIHACVDYLAGITTTNADVETIIGNDLCAKWINNRDYALDTLYANTIIKGYMDTADKYFYGEWVITDNTTTPPTWGPKGNVPVMTSNTAPYGTASASAVYSTGNRQPYYAFDGNGSSTAWSSGNSSNTAYIQFNFTNPINVKRFKIGTGFNGAGIVKTFELKASNDGVNFDDLGSYNGENTSNIQTFNVNGDNYYPYVRLVTTSRYTSDDYNWIHTLQFYGRELSVSVPVMTANNAPYGEVTVSSYYPQSQFQGFHAFDATESGWNPANSDEYNSANLVYKFTTDMVPVMFGASGGKNGSDTDLTTIKLLVSKDGTTYTDTNKTVTINKYSATRVYDTLNLSDSYKYCKFLVTQGVSIASAWGFKFFIYGKDYSEKEFEEGSTKKWLYDHGVELETLDNQGYALQSDYTGQGFDKGFDSIYKAKLAVNNNAVIFSNEKIDLTDYAYLFATNSYRSYHCAIDISSFNTDYYLCISTHTNADPKSFSRLIVANNKANYNTSANKVAQAQYEVDNFASPITVDELWLE